MTDNSLKESMENIVRELRNFKASIAILNPETQVDFTTRPNVPVETMEALAKEIGDFWFQRV